jgi:putative intracellular protease/amidase
MDQVSAVGGLRFTPDVTKDNCPELDLLIVPGGWGTRTQIKNVNLLSGLPINLLGLDLLFQYALAQVF